MGAGNPGLQRPRNDRRFPPLEVSDHPREAIEAALAYVVPISNGGPTTCSTYSNGLQHGVPSPHLKTLGSGCGALGISST